MTLNEGKKCVNANIKGYRIERNYEVLRVLTSVDAFQTMLGAVAGVSLSIYNHLNNNPFWSTVFAIGGTLSYYFHIRNYSLDFEASIVDELNREIIILKKIRYYLKNEINILENLSYEDFSLDLIDYDEEDKAKTDTPDDKEKSDKKVKNKGYKS